MTQLIKANYGGLCSVIFCDVLTNMSLPKYPAELVAGSTLLETIVEFEQQLLSPTIRNNPDQLSLLLHKNFGEIGASGRTYNREQILRLLVAEDSGGSAGQVHDPVGTQLSTNLVLLRWSTFGHRASHRTSLWFHDQGRWQMLFHQGTLSATATDKERDTTNAQVETTGDEISVRKLRASDADAVFEAFTSDAVMHRQGEASTPANARKYVGALLADWRRQCPLAITKNGRLIGLVCATLDSSNKNAWIWYWMHQAFRGQSLTTRAVATLANYLFEEQDIYRVELGLRANNPGSRHVAEKNGFLREGIERGKFLIDGERINVFTYARLRDDPVPSVVPLPLNLTE